MFQGFSGYDVLLPVRLHSPAQRFIVNLLSDTADRQAVYHQSQHQCDSSLLPMSQSAFRHHTDPNSQHITAA
jgi:hypothetical protein